MSNIYICNKCDKECDIEIVEWREYHEFHGKPCIEECECDQSACCGAEVSEVDEKDFYPDLYPSEETIKQAAANKIANDICGLALTIAKIQSEVL